MAVAASLAATLVASSALAWKHVPVLSGTCSSATQAALTVTANDEGDHIYSHVKSGKLQVLKDGKPVEKHEWHWPANAEPGTQQVIAKFDVNAPGEATAEGKWRIALEEKADQDDRLKVAQNLTSRGEKDDNDKDKDDKGKHGKHKHDKSKGKGQDKDNDDKDHDKDKDDKGKGGADKGKGGADKVLKSNEITLSHCTASGPPSPAPPPRPSSPSPSVTPSEGGGQQPGLPKTGHAAA